MGQSIEKYNEEANKVIADLPNLTFNEFQERTKDMWKLIPYNMEYNPVYMVAETLWRIC